eukprot:2518116-Rhodomonas_salina.1
MKRLDTVIAKDASYNRRCITRSSWRCAERKRFVDASDIRFANLWSSTKARLTACEPRDWDASSW